MPQAAAIAGKQAILDYWAGDMSGGVQTELDVNNAYSAGNLSYLQGEYRVLDARGVQLAEGDFVQLWESDQGGWKILHDNWHAHGVTYGPGAGNDLAESLTMTWTEAYNAADGAGLAALYNDDAMLTTPGEMSLLGRDEIEAFWVGDIGTGDSVTSLELRDAYVDGGLAHLEGRYRVVNEAGEELGAGEYLRLWVRETDQWRIHREMWSAANPR